MLLRRLLILLVAALFAQPALRATPEKWTKAIDDFTTADRTNPPPRDGVVFVGSSSIRRWTTLQNDFPGVQAINRGFGGSELADSVFYADRIVIPYRPRIVVLYAGENDLNAGKTPETVFADFKAFVAKVHGALPQTRIVWIAIKPSPSRAKIKDQVARTNALVAAECKRDPRLAYADVYTPMLTAAGEMRPELFVQDMLHLNEAGYALWTPIVARHLK
jgi:lysophospholipase L1-like esterase